MNIPYGKQTITKEDIEAVNSVLKSDYLTTGPVNAEFEKKFAEYTGAKYATTVANGTAALHLSAMALNVKPGQKIITTPITFAASANCVRYCGGEVVFADIDSKSFLLDINKVEDLLKKSPKNTFSGIIPVDFAGHAVDLEEFRFLADKYNLWILEDACHAPGAWFTDSKGEKQTAGNGKFADLSIFSFHPVKHIACGEGGMITTNNPEIQKKIKLLRSHGITKDKDLLINPLDIAIPENSTLKSYPGWYYEMQELGYNYRLTDIQAALGISQLTRAEQGLQRRSFIAEKYDKAFEKLPVETPKVAAKTSHAWHLYVLKVDRRKDFYDFLHSNGIFAQIHYVPVHLHPYYQQFGWKKGDFPIAEEYYEKCISLPMFPGLTDEQQDFVIEKVIQFFK